MKLGIVDLLGEVEAQELLVCGVEAEARWELHATIVLHVHVTGSGPVAHDACHADEVCKCFYRRAVLRAMYYVKLRLQMSRKLQQWVWLLVADSSAGGQRVGLVKISKRRNDYKLRVCEGQEDT